MISTIFQVIAIATFGAMFAWDVYNISRPTSKRGSKTITIMAILGMMGLSYYLFPVTDKAPPPPAPFAEHNTTVLATVKEGDLLLCTDPASSQVKQVLVIKFISPDKTFIQGRGMDKRGSFEDSFFRADRSNCQLSEPIRDPIKVRLKVGEIVLDGLNPPSPAPK